LDRAAIISHTHLFQDISPDNRMAIAEICLPKTLNKRELLFQEKDKGYSLFILISGAVQLYKTTPDGREVVIKTVKPGEVFGEVILFEEDRYPVSAVALKKSTVFMLPKHQFICLLDRHGFRDDFYAALMKKMRYLAQQIQHLTLHDVEERLLLFLADQFGDTPQLHITLSKKDVAAAINTTPETLSRLLLRLKEEDKLHWEGPHIHVTPDIWTTLKR